MADSIDSLAQLFTVLLIFAFVVAITWFTTRYIAVFQKSRIRAANMELMEAMRLSGSHYLQLVRVGRQYLAIAVSRDRVTVLASLEEEELVFLGGNTEPVADFRSVLARVKALGKHEKGSGKDEE